MFGLSEEEFKFAQSVYDIALSLYVAYTGDPKLNGVKELREVFTFDETPDGIINVRFIQSPTYDRTAFILTNICRLNIKPLLTTSVHTSEFDRIFKPDAPRSELLFEVYYNCARPKKFTSYKYKSDYDTVVVIPDIILYMFEKMINDKCNIQWFHYFHVSEDMFKEYKEFIGAKINEDDED